MSNSCVTLVLKANIYKGKLIVVLPIAIGIASLEFEHSERNT